MKSKKNEAIGNIIDNPVVTLDLLQHLLGDFIGEGCYRYVFDYGKNLVAKIDMGDVLANAVEFDTWSDVMGVPEVAKWFAPVIRCSVASKILIMQRADMDRPISEYPDEIPNFFDDVKKSNFGFIGKQLVCVDYGINQLRKRGLKGWRMKKAVW